MKSRIARYGLAIVFGALATFGLTLATAPSASAMWIEPGCAQAPDGNAYMQIYVVDDPSAPIKIGRWTNQHRWYNYGSYNLTNEYGERRVVNCQWGGARVQLCYGYGGTNCAITIPAGHVWEGSITPINSVKLLR